MPTDHAKLTVEQRKTHGAFEWRSPRTLSTTPQLWVGPIGHGGGVTSDLYLINDSVETLHHVYIQRGASITLDDAVYGNQRPGVRDAVLGPGEAMFCMEYDAMFDGDFVTDITLAYITEDGLDQQYRINSGKHSPAGSIVLMLDGVIRGRRVTATKDA